ncbi:hypothetical protein ACFFX1_11615 [Dactylosporangium sucinum]|uniref:HEAT repeat domain-containing protein n=1 Tax=Dactylosporangium sucinum TaxID=1424081 RepID=A0A917TMH9_9ACTN|nr:hypothetical protein [Dactylosporangium sucinum]GGM28039.1 hypothetical protein GCM10007977_031690 [Dactylosporangium sucinum]
MVTLDGGLEPLRELLTDAPQETRRRLYRAIVRRRRTDLGDGLVDAIRARYGDDEAARLLPACGAATSQRLLPELGYALGSWERLARRHPEAGVRVGGRDRPARRRVETIVARLGEQVRPGAAVRGTLGTAATAMSTRDAFVPAAAGLLLAATDPAAAGEVDRLVRLVGDRPVLAVGIARDLTRRLERHEPLLAVAERLAARPGTADGLFALAYAAQGKRLGWPAAWRELVEQLREHPAEEVRDRALEARLE